MPRKASFIFEVTIRASEAYSLDTVARSPREFKPKDVLNACTNFNMELKSGDPPPFIEPFLNWILADYFALAHRTGLYNRQLGLWTVLSKVARIEVAQQTIGLLKHEPVPVFEIIMQDFRQRPIVFCLYVANQMVVSQRLNLVGVFKNFLNDSRKMPTISGMFTCFQEPLPAEILEYFKKNTEHDHPVGKYDALFSGYSVPVNLVLSEAETTLDSESDTGHDAMVAAEAGSTPPHFDSERPADINRSSDKYHFRLIYPDIARKQSGLKLS